MTAVDISIIMSVYNGEATIARTLESLAALDLRGLTAEAVIVDDASSDQTGSILDRYPVLGNVGVRRITHLQNVGLTASLNEAIAASAGKYLARIDCGDLFHADKIWLQVHELEASPDLVVIGTCAQVVDLDYRPVATIRKPTDYESVELGIGVENMFVHSSVMIRRQALEAVGGYDPTFYYSQDYELWLRLLKVGKGCNLPQALTILVLEPGSITSGFKKYQDEYAQLARDLHTGKRSLAEVESLAGELRGRVMEAKKAARTKSHSVPYPVFCARKALALGERASARVRAVAAIRDHPTVWDSYAVLLLSLLPTGLVRSLVAQMRRLRPAGSERHKV